MILLTDNQPNKSQQCNKVWTL